MKTVIRIIISFIACGVILIVGFLAAIPRFSSALDTESFQQSKGTLGNCIIVVENHSLQSPHVNLEIDNKGVFSGQLPRAFPSAIVSLSCELPEGLHNIVLEQKGLESAGVTNFYTSKKGEKTFVVFSSIGKDFKARIKSWHVSVHTNVVGSM